MSVRAIYRKKPAVRAKTHELTFSISPIRIPKTRPMKHEQAERKFAKRACFILIPADSNTAKSPVNRKYIRTYVTSRNKMVVFL